MKLRLTEAERAEAFRLAWRVEIPLTFAMGVCLLASFLHADTGGWQAWAPLAVAAILFAIAETHLRRIVKRMKK